MDNLSRNSIEINNHHLNGKTKLDGATRPPTGADRNNAPSQETINRFLILFGHGRPDAVGRVALDNGKKSARRERTLLIDPESKTPTVEQAIAGHLCGKERAGVYPLDFEGYCQWAVVEFEAHGEQAVENPREAMRAFISLCAQFGLWVHTEQSKNPDGQSFHDWLFFESPMPASLIRPLLQELTKRAGHQNVEIFPKNDAPDSSPDSAPGGMVYLPYFPSEDIGGLGVDSGRTIFLDDDDHLLSLRQFLDTVRTNSPRAVQEAADELGVVQASIRKPSKNGHEPKKPVDLIIDVGLAAQALGLLDKKRADGYKPWLDVGMSLWHLGDAGFALWLSWSKQSKKYQEGDCEEKWGSFDDGGEKGIKLGSLFHWAEEDSGINPAASGPIIKKAKEAAATNADRPFIDAEIADLRDAVGEIWSTVDNLNNPANLFRRAGQIVRIAADDEGRPTLAEMSIDGLRLHISTIAYVGKRRYNKQTGQEELQPARLSLDTVRAVASVAEPPLPQISRLVEVPVCASDGTLQTMPGYNTAGRCYYSPAAGVSIPDVSLTPSEADIFRAKTLLLADLLGDFPFVSLADRAHALALLLEAFVRDMILGPMPGHMIEAPTAGSGKDLLAEILLYVSTGGRYGVMAETDDDEEWRKRITTALLQAQPAIYVGNLNKPLVSGVIAHALTATIYEDRRLGTNENITVQVRCSWIFTANNPTYTTENARRLVRTRLDPKVDRPWMREGFRHDPLRVWAKENRGELIWAALTLVQNWVARGKPIFSGKALGSYESWSRIIGGILEAAGIEGFLENLAQTYEVADSEGIAWREFYEKWHEAHGGNPVRASEILPIAFDVDGIDIGGKTTQGHVKSLGKALAARRDRIIGAYRLERVDADRLGIRWRLSSTENDPFAGLRVFAPFPLAPERSEHSTKSGGETNPLKHANPQGASTEIGVGDLVNCLDSGGCVVNAAPLVVINIRAHTDGQLYCFFEDESCAWPVDKCELMAGDFEVTL